MIFSKKMSTEQKKRCLVCLKNVDGSTGVYCSTLYIVVMKGSCRERDEERGGPERRSKGGGATMVSFLCRNTRHLVQG